METLETLPAENQAPATTTITTTTTTLERESGVFVSSGGGESVDEPLVVVTSTMKTTNQVIVETDQGSNGVTEGGIADQAGVGEVSAVDENKKDDGDGMVVVVKEEGLKEKVGSLQLNGDDSGGGIRKVEVSGDGISLVVEVSACMAQQETGSETTSKKNSTKDEVLPETTGKDTLKDVEKEVEEGEEKEEEGGEEEDHSHGFSVGDLVWAKIKSHPWWPGLIYDPSNASKSTAKCRRKDRLLVAYFGDHSFAWCDPSQLKAFQENFEKMSTQIELVPIANSSLEKNSCEQFI